MGNEEKMARIPEKIRVLAPAGGMEALQAAVRAGADEVYLGADLFSARAGAKNFTREELGQAVRYCHEYGVQVHLAVNTLLTDDELPRALELIEYGCKTESGHFSKNGRKIFSSALYMICFAL